MVVGRPHLVPEGGRRAVLPSRTPCSRRARRSGRAPGSGFLRGGAVALAGSGRRGATAASALHRPVPVASSFRAAQRASPRAASTSPQKNKNRLQNRSRGHIKHSSDFGTTGGFRIIPEARHTSQRLTNHVRSLETLQKHPSRSSGFRNTPKAP